MSEHMIGKLVADRYRIADLIALGALTTVYRALDTRLDRFVALKTLQPAFAGDIELKQRLLLEARALIRLTHPNITEVYDWGETDDGSFYLAVEYVDGVSLAQLIESRGPFDVDYAIEIVRDVGEALSYIHQQGIIHRDVKPSNILISRDGRVLLSDVGLALTAGRPAVTSIQTILGTPAYMSPEQARGGKIAPSTDIYSLGIVLYELLAGHPPFSGSKPALLRQTVKEPPPPITNSRPDVPKTVEEVLNRALNKQATQRHRTVAQFIADLDEARYASVVHPTKSPEPPINIKVRFGRSQVLRMALEKWVWITLVGATFATVILGSLVRNWGHTSLLLALPIAVGGIAALLIALARGTRAPSYPSSPTPTDSSLPPHLSQRTLGRPDRTQHPTGETIPYGEPPIPGTRTLRLKPCAVAWLLLLNGEYRGHQFPLEQTSTTVGRAPSCDIVLNDPTVSGQHARIQLEEDQFYIYDLGSTNGLFVNGVRVPKHRIHDRDELRIGGIIMLFIQVASDEDLTAEAKRRLREFDLVWSQLTETVRND